MKKAVIDDRNNVLGFVEVEKKTRSIEVAGRVTFATTTEVNYPDMGIFMPNHIDAKVTKVSTNIVKDCFNVKTYTVSSNRKYFTDKNVLSDDVLTAVDAEGNEVFYFI